MNKKSISILEFMHGEAAQLKAGDHVEAVRGQFQGKTGTVRQLSPLGAQVKWDNAFSGVLLWCDPRELRKLVGDENES
jgi:transcription antitermination factor NusG